MTTIETITIVFCCLLLLALALSVGCMHRMYLQGECDMDRQETSQP